MVSYSQVHDYHTHNGFYRGSLEEWTIQDGWRVAVKKGIGRLGITPKVEFNHPKQDFIPLLRDEIENSGLDKIILGVELDIGHPSGQNVLSSEMVDLLDFVIAGPHNQPVRTLVWPDLDAEDLEEYFRSYRDILVNSIRKAPVDIWAHPFLQEVQYTAGRFWDYLEPIFHEMVDLCETQDIALEINENYFRTTAPPLEARDFWTNGSEYVRDLRSVLSKLFRYTLTESNCSFTFGSDTHYLASVGDITGSVSFARELGIPESRFKVIGSRFQGS